MRVWYKPLLVPAGEKPTLTIDRKFTEHAQTAGGYDCSGYGCADEFFHRYFYAYPRLVCYEKFLASHLPHDGCILSIASGRAANEMRFVAQGYNILCSDLEPVCSASTLGLFPGYRFLKWDALRDPLPAQRFDAVICLSFVYLLDPRQLDFFFSRVKNLLLPGGLFILDSAGSADAFWPNLLHEMLLPGEAHLRSLVFNIRHRAGGKERMVVRCKHHGYRYSDAEFVSLAGKVGLQVETIERMDCETELNRSYFCRHHLRQIRLARKALLFLGQTMPYIRMCAFRLVDDSSDG